jgi:hypothetical protein
LGNADDRPQQLVKSSERQPHLGREAIGPQHTSPARSPQRASNIEESGFPDPGLPADDQAAALFPRAPEQILKHSHLANTSDEYGHLAARRGIVVRHDSQRPDWPQTLPPTLDDVRFAGSIGSYALPDRNADA